MLREMYILTVAEHHHDPSHVCCRRARGALVAAVPMPSPPPPAASASAAAIISVGFFSVFFPIVSVSSFRMRAPRHASRRAARCAPLNRAPTTSPAVTTGTITIVDSRVRPVKLVTQRAVLFTPRPAARSTRCSILLSGGCFFAHHPLPCRTTAGNSVLTVPHRRNVTTRARCLLLSVPRPHHPANEFTPSSIAAALTTAEYAKLSATSPARRITLILCRNQGSSRRRRSTSNKLASALSIRRSRTLAASSSRLSAGVSWRCIWACKEANL
mmetsp:Transcript_29566/g.73850  ORF Transcript_29566/g.73850 Transcript_29566/m.73850 type:complete len:271 (+) Transcript_29566:235-1047(+)